MDALPRVKSKPRGTCARRKGLVRVLSAILKFVRGRARDDSGVAALIIVSAIAVIAFTALSIFLNTYIGDRKFEHAKGAASGSGFVLPAVITYYNQQTPTHTIPCPDSDPIPDGVADTTCAGPGTRAGVLPWVTLGLSKDAVVDTYGNYYTYVISTAAKNVCATVTSDLPGATASTTYTGGLLDPTDLALVDSTGASRNVAFAIISHGPNGLGAKKSSGADATDPPSSTAKEYANANAQVNPSATIYSGPFSTDDATYFDDIVYAPSSADLQKACKALTPGGALNADIAENFDSAAAAIDTAKFAANNVTKVTDANAAGNRVANFADNTAYLATASGYNFTPTVRPVYVAAYWTPNVGGTRTHAGMSIATRATLAELASNTDDFTGGTLQRGITFRFYQQVAANISGSTGTANTISIRDDGADLLNSGADTYQLINGKSYLIEAYDNGNDIWMRITQRDDATNTATVRTTNTTDLTGEQRVFFINDIGTSGGSSVSYLDDLFIGVPMLALETGPSSGYAATATDNNDNGTTTGSISLEAWFRARSIPTTGIATVMSKWDTASTDTSAFRLYLNGTNNGQLALGIDDAAGAGDAENFDLGFKPTVGEWAHVAITYDAANRALRFYLNGELTRTATTTLDVSGIRAASQRFIVGAERTSGAAADFFYGDISDVRVWGDVRTADEIRDCFQTRIPSTACPATTGAADLIANWHLDPIPSEGGLAETDAVITTNGVAGTLTGASYVPVLSVYFRPLSTSFCPTGTIAGPYVCDFRVTSAAGSTSTIRIPSNLPAIYAKVWGGGGGGYDTSNDSSAGSGGFTGGLIQKIGALSTIAGQDLDVYVGGGGTGSMTTNTGGHGAAGSGVFANVSGIAGVVAGGGGGASFSNDAGLAGLNCTTVTGTVNQCGLGASGGGGVVAAATSRANGGTNCGGRGGDNSPTGANPPDSGGGADCPDPSAGGDGSGHLGGGAATGSAAVTGGAGGPAFISGGTGYVGGTANRVGAGGAGGGHLGGEAGGYNNSGSLAHGYGGGGGSGTVDSAGVANPVGEAGSVSVGTGFTDATRTTATIGNHDNTVTLISPDLSNSPIWKAGCSISGTNIPNSTTIYSIVSNTAITLSKTTTGSPTPHVITDIVVTCTAGFVPTAGGSSDSYYFPSYLAGSSFLTPGTGGTTGTSVSGHAGAVVILW